MIFKRNKDMKKEVIITCPEGHEVDKEKSTFERIVFKKVIKEINSLEDAIEKLGECDSTVKQLRLLQSLTGISPKLISEIESEIVIKALNDGWTPNWQDSSESKYFIWWDLENNCFYGVSNYSRVTNISSRLCFKRREDAERASVILNTQLKNYYNYGNKRFI